MGDAADGYLGDWLPHKPSCKCMDCMLDRAQTLLGAKDAEIARLREALNGLLEATPQEECGSDCDDSNYPWKQARTALEAQ